MSVSARFYMSASLAVLTAGVVALAPVTPDVATPRVLTADVTLAAGKIPVEFSGAFIRFGSAPSYAVTQAAYLGSDAVAAAASGVGTGSIFLQIQQLWAAIWEYGAVYNGEIWAEIQTQIQNVKRSVQSYIQTQIQNVKLLVQSFLTSLSVPTSAAIQESQATRPSFFPHVTKLINTAASAPTVASTTGPTLLPPPPQPPLASRARAASVTPRQAPTASSIGDAGNFGGATGILPGIVEKLQTANPETAGQTTRSAAAKPAKQPLRGCHRSGGRGCGGR